MQKPLSPALIDKPLVEFIESGVSIILGGRDQDNMPNLVRATGCRVSAMRDTISVFVSMAHAGDLLAKLRSNGAIAVVFCLPSTHRSIQLKGSDARIEPLIEGDWARIGLYRDALVQDIASIGYPPVFVSTMLAVEREDMVAVTFTPHALFEQTPGPDAGKLVGATQ